MRRAGAARDGDLPRPQRQNCALAPDELEPRAGARRAGGVGLGGERRELAAGCAERALPRRESFDRLRQLDGVALDSLGVRAGPGVLRLEGGRERRDGLVIGALEQVPLATLDLEQVPKVSRVEKQLLLRLLLVGRAERDPVEPAG